MGPKELSSPEGRAGPPHCPAEVVVSERLGVALDQWQKCLTSLQVSWLAAKLVGHTTVPALLEFGVLHKRKLCIFDGRDAGSSLQVLGPPQLRALGSARGSNEQSRTS